MRWYKLLCMIPFTSNQRYHDLLTLKTEKIYSIKIPQIHHPVLGGTDTLFYSTNNYSIVIQVTHDLRLSAVADLPAGRQVSEHKSSIEELHLNLPQNCHTKPVCRQAGTAPAITPNRCRWQLFFLVAYFFVLNW